MRDMWVAAFKTLAARWRGTWQARYAQAPSARQPNRGVLRAWLEGLVLRPQLPGAPMAAAVMAVSGGPVVGRQCCSSRLRWLCWQVPGRRACYVFVRFRAVRSSRKVRAA